MFSKIFGMYLVDNKFLSAEQLSAVDEKISSVRVKLGLIAVADDMMTEAQANNVNRIQAMEDKRFGDIAVEKGYLTEEQVGILLKKQGNSYMQFVQTLVDLNYMTLDDINKCLTAFKTSKGFSDEDMDFLKSGDTNKEIFVLTKTRDDYVSRHLGMVARNVIRFISSDAIILSVEKVDKVKLERFGYQAMDGDFKALLGFGASDEAIALLANMFADEEYTVADEDSYDAVCEFTNCINGLFASELSEINVDIDMLPPMSKNEATVEADNMYVCQMCVDGTKVCAISVINSEYHVA